MGDDSQCLRCTVATKFTFLGADVSSGFFFSGMPPFKQHSLRARTRLLHSLGAAFENSLTPKCYLSFPWSTLHGGAQARLVGYPETILLKVTVQKYTCILLSVKCIV